MNILLASDAHRIGGAEHYLLLLARGLKHNGHQVELLCPKRKEWSDFIHQFSNSGIPVHRLKLKSRADFGVLYFLSFLHFPQIIRLKKFFKEHTYDIVHINTAGIETGQTMILAAKWAGIKNIMTTVHTALHIPYHFKNIPIPFVDYFRNKTVNWIISKVNKIIVISNTTAEALSRLYPFTAEKLMVIHNGVEPINILEHKQEIKKALCGDNPEPAPLILCVANLLEEKGLHLLLKGLLELKKENIPFSCLLVGEGPYRNVLEKLILNNNLAQNVKLLGHRSDIRRIMTASDLFVLPSLSEGFPFVILEAMSCGLPVIATKVGGIPEMITHDEDGLLVDIDETDKMVRAITSAIKNLLLNKEVMDKMGRHGKERVIKEFTLDKMIERTITLYQQNLLLQKINE